MTDFRRIALLLADVDGTLLTHDKVLTERARAAVQAARAAGIDLALTSGRPPLGMKMLIEPLAITTPLAGFNGGQIVGPDLSVIEEHSLPPALVSRAVALLAEQGLDVWIYAGADWFVPAEDGPHVARESWTVQFKPRVVADLSATTQDVIKIVGVSDDHERVKQAEAAAQERFGDRATIARSQPYYLDITHAQANKGAVLAYLARTMNLAPEQIATIGDQPNDVRMFDRAGYSVAMGNAGGEVKQHASSVTQDSEHEGFAQALERLVAAHR